MLPALSHVPPAHVKASFELVIEEIADVIERDQFEESVVEKMDELVIYFKSTYIENPIVIKKPPIPIEMWNGTWEKIRKCRSLNMFKKLPRLEFFGMFSFFSVIILFCLLNKFPFLFFFAEKQSLGEGIFGFLS